MGSRISLGAPEWSRGKDLYMGSHILGSRKSLVFFVLYREGSRRFRGFHHGAQGPEKGPHGLRGGATAHMGWLHHSPRHMSFKSRDKVLSLNLKG